MNPSRIPHVLGELSLRRKVVFTAEVCSYISLLAISAAPNPHPVSVEKESPLFATDTVNVFGIDWEETTAPHMGA